MRSQSVYCLGYYGMETSLAREVEGDDGMRVKGEVLSELSLRTCVGSCYSISLECSLFHPLRPPARRLCRFV